VAATLVASAALALLAAWLRWASVCPIGGDWSGTACQRRQDHRFDAVPVTTPWDVEPSWALLGGAAWVLLAVAVVLLPTALPARRWQRVSLAVAALGPLVMGATAVLAGALDRYVEVPLHAVAVYLTVLTLPLTLLLMLARPTADQAPGGPRRGLAILALVLATPLPQVLVVAPLLVPYRSYDTAQWSDVALVPCLLLAAVALRPWTLWTQRSLANQQRAHGLSLYRSTAR